MIWPERRTASLRKAAAAILASNDERLWGYELMKASELTSGTLYPILTNMVKEGWLVAGWGEDPRGYYPRRHYYQLTDLGAQHMRNLL